MRRVALIRTWACLGALTLLLALRLASLAHVEAAVTPSSALRRDVYGGLDVPMAKPTGFFRLARLRARWVLLTPLGHPVWLRAVYGVDWSDGGPAARAALHSKYGGDPMAFARHAIAQLKSWGFNALGEYATTYALPVPTYFHPRGNPDRLPFLRMLNISWYGAINDGHLAPAPFKTLLAGAVDPHIYHGWMGHVPDVFDPNFAVYARNLAADRATSSRQTVFTAKTATGGTPQPSLVDDPWLLGTTPDDADNLFGFGPGPHQPGADGVIHPHIGWIVAVTKPTQAENRQVGFALGDPRTVTYADPVVYTKLAWRRFLETKYKTIAALNAAWGSDYTSFGSDGGWPAGRGLMDENGRHAWIGQDPLRLSRTAPAVQTDMDAFLGLYADRYFQVVSAAIHAATPHQLLLSPVLDSHGGLTRAAILQAAGRYCDALQVAADPSLPQVIARTYALAGRPMFSWLGLRADADSALRGASASPAGGATQADRGAEYARTVNWLFAWRTPSGIAPMIGIDWWEYMDKAGERANWGLVTPNGDAYDGREDAVQRGRDRWQTPTGGELADYGDFLGAVAAANEDINRQLAAVMRLQPLNAAQEGRP